MKEITRQDRNQDAPRHECKDPALSLYAAQTSEKDERHFCICVAGIPVEICTIHPDTYALCRDYLCDSEPEVFVHTTKEQIEYERNKEGESGKAWSDGYLETLAVYRGISEALLDYDTFLMHGAVIAYKDSAYMFTAASGTGKTTHLRKWLENLEDAYVVNGDKPLIRITDAEAIACGTPWRGKERLGSNCMVPLKAIVLMKRGKDNILAEIPYQKALSLLIRQTYMPVDAEKKMKTLTLLSRLNGKVRFYEYEFNNFKEDAFRVAYRVTGE